MKKQNERKKNTEGVVRFITNTLKLTKHAQISKTSQVRYSIELAL